MGSRGQRAEDSTVARMKPCGIRETRATWVVVLYSHVSFLNTVYAKIYKKQGGWVWYISTSQQKLLMILSPLGNPENLFKIHFCD